VTAQAISSRRTLRGVAIVSSAALGVGLSLSPLGAHAAHAASSRFSFGSCPAPETLVSGTTWHTHKLAPGITLSEGNRSDSRGVVKMHVLRINVDQPGVSFTPLMRAVAQRTPLSKLAAGHANLVAAVNTGYFDFNTGAPTQPLIVNGSPRVISTRHQPVLGFDKAGTLQVGKVHLDAKVFTGKTSRTVTGINDIDGGGLQAYNPAWGGKTIPSSWEADARSVVANKLGANARAASVPQAGYELMADGGSSTNWLKSLSSGAKTAIAGKVDTTTKHPFVQAYGVGAEIVKHKGQTRTDLSCDSANTEQPARTAYGIADDGQTLVIGEVEQHSGTNIHGLDEDQMSGFMSQLRVSKAWDLDGSGSTELLAKMPGTSSLELRTYPADGAERPMPVGLGISYKAPKVKKHHHKK
jgi:Phosphodiester glycosidase